MRLPPQLGRRSKMLFLGLDTSNYTTSTALYQSGDNIVLQNKRLLAVKDGSLGLRQSEAVFSHVKQLSELLEGLMQQAPGPVSGVGVSVRPRDAAGSYMPCFLVGETVARSIAAVNRLTVTAVSHQRGHIAAALYSAGQLPLVGKPFVAFHLSGGTTECLFVKPDKELIFSVELVAQSLDLKAGQAVDRVGGMLGLSFPAGRALEALALASQRQYKVKPTFKGADCSLSGIENRCRKMLSDGEAPCDIARFCLDSIYAALAGMTEWVKKFYGELPVVYSGGVMSNRIIREQITRHYGGYFADLQFSSDNAAGAAILACIAQTGGIDS